MSGDVGASLRARVQLTASVQHTRSRRQAPPPGSRANGLSLRGRGECRWEEQGQGAGRRRWSGPHRPGGSFWDCGDLAERPRVLEDGDGELQPSEAPSAAAVSVGRASASEMRDDLG